MQALSGNKHDKQAQAYSGFPDELPFLSGRYGCRAQISAGLWSIIIMPIIPDPIGFHGMSVSGNNTTYSV